MRNVSSLEALHRDYSPKGVRFYYVYKTLAHPEYNGYIKPFSLKERLLHVRDARRRLRTQFDWICDTMTSDVKHALGDAPNSEFVIDPEGRVVRKRAWSRPSQLRADLEELVGSVENPTDPDDLDVGLLDDQRDVATGVVERVKPSSKLRVLKIEPLPAEDDMPFYVKLRAEASDELLDTGQGEMFLGFRLDPIYNVHWNNRADPLQFDLILPEGVVATPASGTGPAVDVKADIDPREFLIDVRGTSPEPIVVNVRYFACDDAETFCVGVSQQYKIYLEVDPQGGWIFSRGGRPTRRPGQAVAGRTRLARAQAADPAVADAAESDGSDARSRSDDPGRTEDGQTATAFTGRLQGRLRGTIDGQLNGSFRGEIRGTVLGAGGALFNGRFEGRINGRFRGEIDGDFDGEFDGVIGTRQ